MWPYGPCNQAGPGPDTHPINQCPAHREAGNKGRDIDLQVKALVGHYHVYDKF